MKLKNTLQLTKPNVVAPYVGAWIETLECKPAVKSVRVAPYVGAWIETCYCFKSERF